MKLQVTACDIDQKFPARTYTITSSDGRSISKDLCEEHAVPFEEWLQEADGQQRAEPGTEAEPPPVVPKRGTARKTATAKKATPARRRPKITSLAEIEASKRG
ncbi:hypothetical protein [Streptomyces sp. NPDC059874]|uniref:hypothetical protein n=1 Tax=Streptomyces sp. NPDC059874 TaxID=3346983 RepID=UPI00364D4040